MRPSGGLIYFLRFLRFGKELWNNHHQQVKRFLEAWNPKAKTLVLVGPSAGFSIPPEFLIRFESIVAVEPDFYARLLFESRFQLRPKWVKKSIRFEVMEDLQSIIENNAAAILFCNVLGQVVFKNFYQSKKILNEFLAGREWASYHDALSANQIEFDLEDARPEKATLAQIKSFVFVKNPKAKEIELNAHPAFDLFESNEGMRFTYWQWQILPNRTHLIEGVFSVSAP